MDGEKEEEEGLTYDFEKDEEEEKPQADLTSLDNLELIKKNPSLIIQSDNDKVLLENSKVLSEFLSPQEEANKKAHHGYLSSFSFGEKEFERLSFLLGRLDLVAEAVTTYREENLTQFPEYYALVKNLYINIKFILSSYDRERINEAFKYIRLGVINYTTKHKINWFAVMCLEEVHQLIMNLKNFHGLGFSYEERGQGSAKYEKAFFSKKLR